MLTALIASLVVYEDCYEYVNAVEEIQNAIGLKLMGCGANETYDGPLPYPGFCDGMIQTNISESCSSSGEYYMCPTFEAVPALLQPWNYNLTDLCKTTTSHFEWNLCGITIVPALAPTDAECDYFVSGDNEPSETIHPAGWAGIGIGAAIALGLILFIVCRSSLKKYEEFI